MTEAVKPKEFTPNSKQQLAIDTIYGPVMLLAGPGSGKTFTLTRRIRKMLQEGVKPAEILCLTFSDTASIEMKTRIVELAGLDAMGVSVSTYHSFCKDIIDRFPSKFELLDKLQVVDDITKQAIVKESIDELHQASPIQFLKDKWNNRYHYVGQIIDAIDFIKRERITREQYFEFMETDENWLPHKKALEIEYKEREQKNKLVKTFLEKIESFDKKIGKAKEFFEIYELYEKNLHQHNLIDFSDMLNFVIKTFEYDDELLKEVAGDFKFILVDEYQDTNSSQNELIFSIARGANTDNIFVVGDDDQIIYAFQGARCDNLKAFLRKYPNAQVICLEESNRSAQNILDFAESIIKNDPSRLTNDPEFKLRGINKCLTATNKKVIEKEEKIHFTFYGQTLQETRKIVEEIEKLINKGVEPKEIAILTRKNKFLGDFAKNLKAKNIPYQQNKQKSVFEIPSFILTYFYLKALENNFKSGDKLFGLLVNEPFSVSEYDYFELLKLQRTNNKGFYQNIEENLDTIFEKSYKLKKFFKTFQSLKKKKSVMPLVPFIHNVITESGILEFFTNSNDNKFENIAALKRLVKEVSSYALIHNTATLSDFLSHLDTYLDMGIKMEVEKNPYSTNAVQLLTYHGSKGREFSYVFMPQLTAKLWEKSRGVTELDIPVKKSQFMDDKKENKTAELLKLLFVGITRSKYGLYLSYANADEDMNVQAMSEYFQNNLIDNPEFTTRKTIELDLETYTEEIKNYLTYKENENVEEELKLRTENFAVSASALNAYLNCPLRYYYSNILEIPVFIETTDKLSYGSAVHKTIEKMAKIGMERGEYPSKEEVIGYFKDMMSAQEFSDEESREEYLQRGEEVFDGNYLKFKAIPVTGIVANELPLEYKEDGYILKGFVDRVTCEGGKIYIYDFKTGTPKKVKPDEDYHNQLRFYKYLYEKINPGKEVQDCALLYVEKDFTYSRAELTKEDNEIIEAKIQDFVKAVKNLDFHPTPSASACKYCPYSLMCKLAVND